MYLSVLKNFIERFGLHILALISLVLFSMLDDASAKVRKIKSNILFEGESFLVAGQGLTSKSNPASVRFIDGEGTTFAQVSNFDTLTPKRAIFQAPTVSSTKTLIMRFAGGNVSNGEDFAVVIFDKPDLSSVDPSPPDDDINVGSVTAEGLILNNTTLNASTTGILRWNGQSLVDKSGKLLTNRLDINGKALTTDSNGGLTWNSHLISTAGGIQSADNLGSQGYHSGQLTYNGSVSTNIQASSTTDLVISGNGAIASIIRAEYDRTVDSGSTGTVNLRNAVIPNNARVIRAWYDVLTTFTSASDTASIGISIPTDDSNGILAPIAISDASNPWDAGIHSTIQSGLVSGISEKTTAARNLQLVISGEAVTAGKAVIYAEYVLLP